MAKGLPMVRATLRENRPAAATCHARSGATVTDCSTPTCDGGSQVPSGPRPIYDGVQGGRRPVRAHRPPEGSAARPGEL